MGRIALIDLVIGSRYALALFTKHPRSITPADKVSKAATFKIHLIPFLVLDLIKCENGGNVS